MDWIKYVADAFRPDPMALYLEEKLDPAAKRRSLASSTHLSEDEVGFIQVQALHTHPQRPHNTHAHIGTLRCTPSLRPASSLTSSMSLRLQQRAYSNLKFRSASGVVDLSCLEAAFGAFLPPGLLSLLFAMWDRSKSGVLDVAELVTAVALCCNGTMDERAQYAFSIFDPERSGVVSSSMVCPSRVQCCAVMCFYFVLLLRWVIIVCWTRRCPLWLASCGGAACPRVTRSTDTTPRSWSCSGGSESRSRSVCCRRWWWKRTTSSAAVRCARRRCECCRGLRDEWTLSALQR